MGLNKTNGNMYPWVTHTWNPLAGKCLHDCSYCYMKQRFLGSLKKYQGNTRIDKNSLVDDLGINNTIFVGSATDIFGKWVPDTLINQILTHCKKYNNTYLFQSKDPGRIKQFIELLPDNSIIGTTLETNRDYEDISKAPLTSKRYKDFLLINYPRKMISIEPVLDFDLDEFFNWIKNINPNFVSIGADSKYNNLPEPNHEKIEKLVRKIQCLTEIRVKKNLGRVVKIL